MRFLGLYAERGLGVFTSPSKMQTARKYLPKAVVKGFEHYQEAADYARYNYNLLVEQRGENAGMFPAEEELRINRTYYKNEIMRGESNYEF